MTAREHRRARRVAAMRRLRAQGWTLERIGKRYGITKQRVGQLLAVEQAQERG